MDTKALDKIKTMREAARSLLSFHAQYKEKYAPNSNCDKKGYGFGLDTRFAAFKLNTHFASWAGYYGNSSCGTILSVSDSELVGQYLIQALNVHQEELFATAARLIQQDAQKLTVDAEKEITALNDMLRQAQQDVEAKP